jgi:hypothetical protein
MMRTAVAYKALSAMWRGAPDWCSATPPRGPDDGCNGSQGPRAASPRNALGTLAGVSPAFGSSVVTTATGVTRRGLVDHQDNQSFATTALLAPT